MMELNTLADWRSAGGAELAWRLATARPPATFAVCRHYASWMKAFRLYLFSMSHEATEHLEFLEAVDELREWEPNPALARRIYDLYLNDEKDDGRKRIRVSAPSLEVLAGAFGAVHPPARAGIFEAAYKEVVLLVNESAYRDFKAMTERLRARPPEESEGVISRQVTLAIA
jgi:hypothetical protein